jgi:predicted secreted protein
MPASATYSATLDYSDDGATYNSMDGARSADLSRICELLDVTDFDSAGQRARIPGLLDSSITVQYDIDYADTAQNEMRAAWLARTESYVRFLPDGTNGAIVQGYISAIDESGAVDGKGEGSFTISQSAAITAVP